MGTSRDLERDLELDQKDTEDVKGGGIVSASATVGGVGSVTVDDANTSVTAGGTSAGTSMNSQTWGASAKSGGQSASAGGKRPNAKRPRKKR